MRQTRAILLSGLLLGSACVSLPSQLGPESWVRPDGSEADFKVDRAACISASQAPMSLVASGGNVMRMDTNETAFLACMRQQGWDQL